MVEDFTTTDQTNESLKSTMASAIVSILCLGSPLLDTSAAEKNLEAAAKAVPKNEFKISNPDVQKALGKSVVKAADKKIAGYSVLQVENMITRTLYAELNGEPDEAFWAVADVIWKRAGGDIEKVPGVISKPKQFSSWNSMTKDDWKPENFKVKFKPEAVKTDAWHTAAAIADLMVNGKYRLDHKEGFTNYYASSGKYGINPPSWAKGLKNKTVIGHHTFGKL